MAARNCWNWMWCLTHQFYFVNWSFIAAKCQTSFTRLMPSHTNDYNLVYAIAFPPFVLYPGFFHMCTLFCNSLSSWKKIINVAHLVILLKRKCHHLLAIKICSNQTWPTLCYACGRSIQMTPRHPQQQEWQLCGQPCFNATLPLIYWSWGMHHLLWSYWFLSTCHLTPSATLGEGMGLRWCEKHLGWKKENHCKKHSSIRALWRLAECLNELLVAWKRQMQMSFLQIMKK